MLGHGDREETVFVVGDVASDEDALEAINDWTTIFDEQIA